MRTITYDVCEHDDEDHGHFFTVLERETLHTVTGDEVREIEVPVTFETVEDARAFITRLMEA
mgnify:CR=1 FL=1